MSSVAHSPTLNGANVSKHSRCRSDSSIMHLSDDDLKLEDPFNENLDDFPMRRVSSIPTQSSGSWVPNSLYTDESDVLEVDSDEDLHIKDTSNIAHFDHDLQGTLLPTRPQIPLRRVVSSPTNRLKSLVRSRSVQFPSPVPNRRKKHVQWEEKTPISEAPVIPVPSRQVASPYPMRRYNSLPMRPTERSSRNLQIHLARTDSSSSLSSDASKEEELTWLASPTSSRRQKVNQGVFRSFRKNTPKSPLRNSLQTSSKRMNAEAPADSQQYICECRTDSSLERESGLVASRIANDPKDPSASLESRFDVVSPDSSQTGTRRRNVAGVDEVGDGDPAQDSLPSSRERDVSTILLRNNLQYAVYLSAFAMFGSIIRVYMARLFGFDCEFPDAVNDFLSPLSTKICVTATGRTFQTGGALFVDLPANMFGSFILGLMTSLEPDIWPPLPWLRDDHPLQNHDALHVAIKTGLCGSLTTFASWNSQMIVMLDGTATELGSQVLPALFGFLLGLYCAVASFVFGVQVSTWLNRWKSPNVVSSHENSVKEDGWDVMEGGGAGAGALDLQNQRGLDPMAAQVAPHFRPLPARILVYSSMPPLRRGCHWCQSLLNGPFLPFVILGSLLAAFICADVVFGNAFYRSLWMATLITPPGALLRWTLAKLNCRSLNENLAWIPWGTVAANLLGSVIYLLLLAIETRHISGDKNSNEWLHSSVGAVRVGFAGSLSTVSTFVKEIVELKARYPHHAKAYYYAVGTTVTAILLGICVYAPIVR